MRRIAAIFVVAGGVTVFTQQAVAPTEKPLRFEVASIRPSAGGNYGVRFLPDASLSATSAVVEPLILLAYNLSHPSELAGKPKWVDEERYDIQAKSPQGASAARPEMLRRLQALLEDRFALQMHTESRMADVYVLTFARKDRQLGKQIAVSTIDCAKAAEESKNALDKGGVPSVRTCAARFSIRIGPSGVVERVMYLSALPMSQIAMGLSPFAGRRIVDQTGLSGLFDIELSFSEDEQLPATTTIFTSVQEQLGLKLEARRMDVPVFVIDRIERPTPN